MDTDWEHERGLFELWAARPPFECQLFRHRQDAPVYAGEYVSAMTHAAWEAWKARAVLAEIDMQAIVQEPWRFAPMH